MYPFIYSVFAVHLWDCDLITTFLAFFSSLQILHITLPEFLRIFFAFFRKFLMHAYMHLYIHRYNNPKYDLSSPFNITLMCVLDLTLWHWTANWCTLPREGPPLQLYCLPSFVYGWGLGNFSPCSLACMLVSLLSSCLGSRVGEALLSDITRRHNVTAKPLTLWLPHSLYPVSHGVPWAFDVGGLL